MGKALAVLGPILVIGLIGAVVSFRAHESDPGFLFSQQHASHVTPVSVERVVTLSKEPVPPGTSSTKASSATCKARGQGELRNPWTCRIRYRSGHVIAYRVDLTPDGRAHGQDSAGVRRIQGCCVEGL
jgi:hypothetical protein